MNLIDGRKIRDEILDSLKEKIQKSKIKPALAIILVGENKASVAYVHQKKIAGEKIGAEVSVENLGEKVSQSEIENLIHKINHDEKVHGIILQRPLPEGLDLDKLTNMISLEKDVDGFVPNSEFKPATAKGVIELLKKSGVKIIGKKVVVIGRGKIAGKPTTDLLREEGADVSVVHSKTKNPKEITREADILVSAVGKPKLVTEDMVKPGAVVVDVGINPIEEELKIRLVGDVDFENVKKIASKITPVPGGVGPMTVASLMQNLFEAATKLS